MPASRNSKISRLDKFIAEQMAVSREDARKYIKKRSVTVNGVTARLYDMKINVRKDTVTVEGNEILYRSHIYIMMNKPKGVICAVKDRNEKTVIDLLPENLKRKGLFPAGRLDRDTEGFVLITDDGELSHKILSPRSHVPKVYFARLLNEADNGCIKEFEEGIVIDGGDKCLPAGLEILSDKQEVLITLYEGKYHQVKRMFHAAGNEVVYLKRIRIGGISLDENLAHGEAREILHKDICNIYTFF